VKIPFNNAWKPEPSARPRSLEGPPDNSDFPSIKGGLPHSEIHGSKLIRSSPRLFAAYHVLHRLCMPRHPPNALTTLNRSHCQCSSLVGSGKPCLLACARRVPNLDIRTPQRCRASFPTIRLPFTTGRLGCHRRVRSAPLIKMSRRATSRGRILRPASRDKSEDARSGNIHQILHQTRPKPQTAKDP
jgi:hypothetical protein